MAARADRAGRCAQRRRRAPGRRRVRAVRLLRLRHRDPLLRRPCLGRAPLLELPHDRALLTDARVPPHRTEPPLERHGPRRRVRRGVPGLQRHHPEGERLPLGDPPAQRLRHLRGRQVASDPGHGDDDGEPAGQVAPRPGLRALLRLHGRRDRPVPPRARVRQPPRRAAPHAGGGLPPHGGPGRQGDPLHAGPARVGARPALLPVVHPGRVPCPPPRADRLHRAVPRPLRPGVGRLARRGLPAPAGVRPPARGHAALRSPLVGARVGFAHR